MPIATARQPPDQEAARVAADDLLAPFVPSPPAIVARMLELARVRPGDVVFDLGSGDGRTVIMAAQNFGAKAVGVELDDQRFKQSSARIAKLALGSRAGIVQANLFHADLRKATVVTLYLLSRINERLRPILERQLRPGARVVAHDFPVPGWKPEKVVTGVLPDGSPHAIYLYLIGQPKEQTMPITADKRGYVGGRFVIELEGVSAGSPSSAEGGYATADVVVEKLGADNILHKHIAGVRYEDITINCGTEMSKGFYDWLQVTVDQKYQRKNGAIVTADSNLKEVSRLNFYNALITEIGFPALDAGSKDAAKMTVKITPEYTDRAASGGASSVKSGLGQSAQKKWLPSNFRLTIDGLDCTRVNKIGAITLRQHMVDNAVGELRDSQKEPAYLEVPNLVVTLAESHAQEFYDWHQDFVIKGNNGDDKERNGALEYLTPNLKDVLFTLTFKHLGIFKLCPEKVEAGGEAIRRVCAEMYCEGMGFSYVQAATAAVGSSAGTEQAQPQLQPQLQPAPLLPAGTVAPTQIARLGPPLRFRA